MSLCSMLLLSATCLQAQLRFFIEKIGVSGYLQTPSCRRVALKLIEKHCFRQAPLRSSGKDGAISGREKVQRRPRSQASGRKARILGSHAHHRPKIPAR
jgi:hypothetical protein